MGDAASKAVSSADDMTGGMVSGLGGQIFGDSQNAGMLGAGQYKAGKYDVNADAFTNNQAQADLRSQFAQQLAASGGRNGPQIIGTDINQGPQNEFRDNQMSLMKHLQQAEAGQGPSLAGAQLQAGTEGNIRQAMALGATKFGGNPALAQRNIMQQASNATQQSAQQAAMLRMQEQLQARQQLAGVMDAARGQDIGLANQQAALSQQANVANQQSTLAQNAHNDEQARFYNTGLMNSVEQDQANKMALEKLRADQQQGMNSVNAQSYQSAGQNRGKILSGLGQAVASGGKMAKGGLVKKMASGGSVHADQFMNQFAMRDTGGYAHPSNDPLGNIDASGRKKEEPIDAASSEKMAGGDDAGMSFDSPAEMLASEGGAVPGIAEVAGDSEKNDKVHVLLSPGEIVLPRTVAEHAMQDAGSPKVKAFILALQKDHKKMSKGGYCMSAGGEVYHDPFAKALQQSRKGK